VRTFDAFETVALKYIRLANGALRAWRTFNWPLKQKKS
jgi:hypothetical protein